MSVELSEAIIREQTVNRLADQVRAVGTALPGTENQIALLINHDFALGVGNDGLPQLTAKSGRPVAEEIAARLADPEFQHFKSAEAKRAEAADRFTEKLKASIAAQRRGLGDAPGLSGVRRLNG